MSEQWYYARDGKTLGPFPFEQLKALAGSGQLAPTDYVLKAGTTNWLPAAQVPELFLAGAVPPPLPPGPPIAEGPPPLSSAVQPPADPGQVVILSKKRPGQNPIGMALLSGIIWFFPVGHLLLGQKIKTFVIGGASLVLILTSCGIFVAASPSGYSSYRGEVPAGLLLVSCCEFFVVACWMAFIGFDAYLLAIRVEEGHNATDWEFPVIEKIQSLFKKP